MLGLISLSSHVVFLTSFYCRQMKAQVWTKRKMLLMTWRMTQSKIQVRAEWKMLVRTWRTTQSNMHVRMKRKMLAMTSTMTLSKIDLLINYGWIREKYRFIVVVECLILFMCDVIFICLKIKFLLDQKGHQKTLFMCDLLFIV